jgi:CheY-like chemotaxis protein
VLVDATHIDSAEKSTMRRESRNSKRELQGLKILVVEDNAINQQVAEGLLGAQGASVSIAADGRQGVNAIAAAKEQYDIVLMDIQMPVMDGYEATRVIREQLGLEQLPIIGLTANAMASDREKCLAAGMNEHVGKPFDLAQLVSMVIRLTGHRPTSDTSSIMDSSEDVTLKSEALPDAFSAISDQIDVPTALRRMGGMTSLYSRSARDLLQALPTLVPQLTEALRKGETKSGATLLHTFKGTTATLGLNALSAELGHLEDLCNSESRIPKWEVQLNSLSVLVKSGQTALEEAMEILERSVPAASLKTSSNDYDARQISAQIRRLVPLLDAKDMTALEVYAEAREELEALPAELFDRLDNAMQGLEFEDALKVCQEIVGEQNEE